MYKNALIALDLSPATPAVLSCMPALRDWGVQSLRLLHVLPVSYMQGISQAFVQDYQHWLEQLAEPMQQQGFDVSVEVRIAAEIATEIHSEAEQAETDLVVIGSRAHNVISRLFLGSVAREAVRLSDKPLLLQWLEPVERLQANNYQCDAICIDTLRHVLLATDFSAASTGIEQTAEKMATLADVMECVHVLESATPGAIEEEQARQQLQALQDRLRGQKAQIHTRLLHGKASTALAAHANEVDASLIMIGKHQQCKHQQSRLGSKLIGSTASNVCEHAGRSVLMVP